MKKTATKKKAAKKSPSVKQVATAFDKVKQARESMKQAKVHDTASRKIVSNAQRVFKQDPTNSAATKAYREAVGLHIKAAKAAVMAKAKLNKLTAK